MSNAPILNCIHKPVGDNPNPIWNATSGTTSVVVSKFDLIDTLYRLLNVVPDSIVIANMAQDTKTLYKLLYFYNDRDKEIFYKIKDSYAL